MGKKNKKKNREEAVTETSSDHGVELSELGYVQLKSLAADVKNRLVDVRAEANEARRAAMEIVKANKLPRSKKS